MSFIAPCCCIGQEPSRARVLESMLMNNSLILGLERRETLLVDNDRCVQFLGESDRVYSTPDMISDVEYACLRLIAEHIEETHSSLGVLVHWEHLAATPCGEQIHIHVRIDRIEGARVYLQAEVRDKIDLLGRGEHVRHVIDRQRLAQGLIKKRHRLDATT